MRPIYNPDTKTRISGKLMNIVDPDTGEVVEYTKFNKRMYGAKQFWKVYLTDFLAVLGIIDSKQLDVFVYIVSNTNPANNIFMGTYDEIMAGAKVSRGTVCKIMKKLQDNDFIRLVRNGRWAVNPDIMLKGDERKHGIMVEYYRGDEQDYYKDSEMDFESNVKEEE